MSSQIILSVDKEHPSVAPGGEVELAVTVKNQTQQVHHMKMTLEGIDSSWVEVIQPLGRVYKQDKKTGRVVIRPPRDQVTSLAGTYAIRVKAASQEDPSQKSEATIELEVRLISNYHLQVWLGAQEQDEKGYARYAIELQNNANARLNAAFKGDPDKPLFYKFDPPNLDIPAGSKGAATLIVKAKGQPERPIPFALFTERVYQLRGDKTLKAPEYQKSTVFDPHPSLRLHLNIEPSYIENKVPAEYEIHVENPTQSLLNVSLTAWGNQNLHIYLKQKQVRLTPQTDERIGLIVYPKIDPSPGQKEENIFHIKATPLGGESIEAKASLTLIGKPDPMEKVKEEFQRVLGQVTTHERLLRWLVGLVATQLLLLICMLILVFTIYSRL